MNRLNEYVILSPNLLSIQHNSHNPRLYKVSVNIDTKIYIFARTPYVFVCFYFYSQTPPLPPAPIAPPILSTQ